MKKDPKFLSSTDFFLIRAAQILSKKVFIIISKCELFNLGCLVFNCLMSLGLDNYFSSFLFFLLLPIAFSNIPFSVAPDLVAPSPNLAIRDFSSSI